MDINSTKLITPNETAGILRVSVDTVRRLLRTGKLHGTRVGGQWRVYEGDIRETLLGRAKVGIKFTACNGMEFTITSMKCRPLSLVSVQESVDDLCTSEDMIPYLNLGHRFNVPVMWDLVCRYLGNFEIMRTA